MQLARACVLVQGEERGGAVQGLLWVPHPRQGDGGASGGVRARLYHVLVGAALRLCRAHRGKGLRRPLFVDGACVCRLAIASPLRCR